MVLCERHKKKLEEQTAGQSNKTSRRRIPNFRDTDVFAKFNNGLL